MKNKFMIPLLGLMLVSCGEASSLSTSISNSLIESISASNSLTGNTALTKTEWNDAFSYFYNGEKTLSPGIRVLVNFNNKDIIGYVLSVKEYSGTAEEYQKESIYVVKEVKEIIDETPLLNSELQNLAKDIADYYFSPLISVYQAMLPPSLKP